MHVVDYTGISDPIASGRTGKYREPTPGESGPNNILKMAREGLRRELITSLHKVAGTRETVRCPGLRVRTNGDVITVNLIIRPVAAAPAASPEPPCTWSFWRRIQ